MKKRLFTGKTLLVTLALTTVYICWGGTYLAMRYAVETMPPLLMAGFRFTLAGLLLYGLARWRGAPAPTGREWLEAGVVGVLLLGGGNGGVVLAAGMVPSGLSALMVATAPLWMVLLNWLWLKDIRPGLATWAGVVLGLAGIGLLSAGGMTAGSLVAPLWAAVLTASAFLWALGSVYSRKAVLPPSAIVSTGVQMLVGGVALLAIGMACGETTHLDLTAMSPRSLVSLAYLIVFGSWAGFGAYVWLLQNVSSVLASTYAYVNPVVAVLVGAAIGGEELSARTLTAAAVIVLSVVLLSASRLRRSAAAAADPVGEEAGECPCKG